MRQGTGSRFVIFASLIALGLAACAPETVKPAAEARTPAVRRAADPGETSLVMAADPARLGFDLAVFEKAKAELEADVKAGTIPGAVFLVARGGQVANLTTVGTEGPDDADIASPETVFRIYSMTKPVVSVAAMQLVEEGKLALEDPISKYIPEFANPKVLVGKGKTRPAAREITVRDLLSHTSGLIYGVFAEPEDELGKLYMAAGDTRFDVTALNLARAIAALPLESDPGAKWRYSRSTDVLGAVIEVASGKPLDLLLDEKIFTPLGMNDTHFYLEPDEVSRLAEPPKTIAPLSAPQMKQPMLSGGGGLNSTTEDYFRFVEMLRGRGEYRGVRIIKPSTLDQMLVDQIGPAVDRSDWFYGASSGFGLGFGLIPVDPKDPSKGKTFSWSGYAGTTMWVDPTNDITVVFMIQNNEAAGKYGAKAREWVYTAFKPPAAPRPAPAAAAAEQ